MVLTDKQRQDLHQSMVDYLVGMGDRFADTAAAFAREAEVTPSKDGKHAGLLEKKWTSVIRLQRKVMELESKVVKLEENSSLGQVVSRREMLAGGRSRAEFLPRGPAKYSLTGHRSPVTCVAFHPVYSVLVSGSEDATLKIWDFETGEYERTLKGHTNAVQAVAFNSTGQLLASTSADLTIKLWDFSNDGDYECLKTLRGHDHNISGVVFAPSTENAVSDRLYSCSRDHTIKVWEISTGYCLHTLNGGHSDWVRDVAVSDDGLYLASCGNDRSVLFWDLQHMRLLQSLREHEHVVESVVFATSGLQEQAIEKAQAKQLAAIGATTATANGQAAAAATANGNGTAVVEGRRIKFLLSGSRDRTVRLWEAFSGTLLMTFVNHENWVRSVRFHPCGKYAISASEDKTIRVYDLETGRCVRTIEYAHTHFLTCVDVHPSLPLVISGGIDKVINVWECS